MKRDDYVVSASEIASWSWCPESWRLGALGLEPGNKASLAYGETHHRRKARLEVRTRAMLRIAVWLLVAAVVLAAIAFYVGSVPE